MQTFSIFPNLLFLGLLAPTLIRISIGIISLLAGQKRYKSNYKWSSILYFINGFFLIIGMYTQAFALVGIVLVIFQNYADGQIGPISREQKILQSLLIILSISLLLTGAGLFAIDLPL